MQKRMALILAVLLVVTALSGCNILEAGTPPTLPKLDIDNSSLVAQVEYVNGRTCRIRILEGDSHFDAAGESWEADVIFVSYTMLEGSKSVQVGDKVSFTYSYTEHVSERGGDPHISVKTLVVE